MGAYIGVYNKHCIGLYIFDRIESIIHRLEILDIHHLDGLSYTQLVEIRCIQSHSLSMFILDRSLIQHNLIYFIRRSIEFQETIQISRLNCILCELQEDRELFGFGVFSAVAATNGAITDVRDTTTVVPAMGGCIETAFL